MKRMTRCIIFIVSLGLLIGLLVSVATKHAPVTCDQILDTQLRALNFDSLTYDTIEQWIMNSYGLTDADILVGEGQYKDNSGRIPKVYAWSFRGKRYDTTTSDSYIMVRLSDKPTAREVLACFGAPSHYMATNMVYGDRTFIFELWYPEKGIVVKHTLLPGDVFGYLLGWSRNSDDNTLMDTILVMKPNTVDAMINQIYSDNNRGKVISVIRAWPGKLDQIQIDVWKQ